MGKSTFIKDAIYGYLIFTNEQISLIDSFPIQRLKRIRQLAGSEYVYATATHCRFSHSLGVSYLGEQLISNLLMKNNQDERLISKIKIAALLHDIGHSSFSHVFESILADIGKNHEDMTEWLIKESEIAGLLEKIDLDPKEISLLAVGKVPGEKNKYLNQIISSGIDVDSFDYIVRDSQFSGASYGFVDIFRLMLMTSVINNELAVNLNALNTLEAFVIARYESFKSIYFHKTSRAAQIMLANALQSVKEDLGLTGFDTPHDYLKWDDYSMWYNLSQNKKSKPIIDDLSRRKLLKVAYDRSAHAKDQMFTSLINNFRIKEQIQREIAEKVDLQTKDVIIDLPNLPSVPYHASSKIDPLEIPIFEETKEGSKNIKRVSDVSSVIAALKGFLNIIRIYTSSENREKVNKAANQVFGEETF
ncbi:MAG: HD domain-containing protein [Candidatus Lokiarchaeota archaeon]|nr:HD domain-containing protein [Candidatus Lokiarchaeota archaeon]